jgi:ABC-type microcin C transport system duplicated ATPase subunit YejF
MLFEGQNVLDLDDKALRKFHWHKVAMVFKSAMNSLNPVLHVETQLHDRHQGRAKADWLAILMSPDPKSLMRAAEARKRPYPRSSL